MAKSKKPPKSCKAWHAGDGGVGRDTLLGRMTAGRSTGHFGTGTYFVSSKDRLTSAYDDRSLRCIPVGRARLLKPESNEAAQRLFSALRKANDSVAYGDFLSEDRVTDDEGAMTQEEVESRFSSVYDSLRAALPELKGRAGKVAEILEYSSDAFEDCRRGDRDSCEEDSASTKILRAAGYDGVDVRGLNEFDNTMHGSVLFRGGKKR
jgi:hypothetical protein